MNDDDRMNVNEYKPAPTPADFGYPAPRHKILTEGQKERVAQVRAMGDALEEMIDELRAMGDGTVDQRWLSIGTTDLQKGLMAVVRSIVRPEFF